MKEGKQGAGEGPAPSAPDTAVFDPSSIGHDIEKLLRYSTFEPEERYWLYVDPLLNGVLGSKEKGLAYGKQYELSGAEGAAKTSLATILAGMAQRDGAIVGRIDLEDSRDPEWDRRLGLDSSKVVEIYPKLIRPRARKAADDGDDAEAEEPAKKKGKKKASSLALPMLQSAEQLFTEAEVAMARIAAAGYKKQFWFLDSIANLQTEMAGEAGNTDWNMRVNFDRALFLSRALPKWAGLAANYNAMIFMLNQLRVKAQAWGDPFDSPGGKSLRHNCAIRARIRRRGELKRGTKVLGIVSIIKNVKNKAGGGSLQSLECGLRILWGSGPMKVAFMSREEADAMFPGQKR